MKDITYCDNQDCPFSECFRHYSLIPKCEIISIANFGSVCKPYLNWILKEIILEEGQ